MKTNDKKPMKNYLFLLAALLLIAAPAYGDEALVHKQAGDAFLRHGEISSAISEYQKATESNPYSSAVYFNMAIAYYSEMDLKNASLALEKVLALEPNDGEAIYNLACLKLYQRDLEGAKSHFQKTCACTGCPSKFNQKSQDALDFIKGIEKMDPLMQNAFFVLLQKNLPVLARS